MIDGGRYSKGSEAGILAQRDHMVRWYLEAGKHVIVDDTNLEPKHEEVLRKIAKETGATFRIQDFTDISVEECIKRNSKRENSVPEKVITDMYNMYLKVHEGAAPTRTLKWEPQLGNCIICDIDGTLAHNDGHRHWTDYAKVGGDKLIPHIRTILEKFRSDYHIILLSGREETCRKQTIGWLDKHNVPRDALYMRKQGDYRKDFIIKKELYEAHIEGVYNTLFVLDDRNQVVDLWRKDIGIPCLQVNYGDF
jgi:hypothetical protein